MFPSWLIVLILQVAPPESLLRLGDMLPLRDSVPLELLEFLKDFGN